MEVWLRVESGGMNCSGAMSALEYLVKNYGGMVRYCEVWCGEWCDEWFGEWCGSQWRCYVLLDRGV